MRFSHYFLVNFLGSACNGKSSSRATLGTRAIGSPPLLYIIDSGSGHNDCIFEQVYYSEYSNNVYSYTVFDIPRSLYKI